MFRRVNMRWLIKGVTLFAAVLVLGLFGVSGYMLNYSLSPDPNRQDVDSAYADLYRRYPDMRQWVEHIKANQMLRSVYITMPNGQRHHALYITSDSAQGRTAVVVHGYRDCSIKFLYLARMYHRDLGYNVLLPDLSAHGLSEGREVQMGWRDATDLLSWCAWLEQQVKGKQEIVLHGVSMGAATVMNLSGLEVSSQVKGIVEDCGFTSVWDEFSCQLSAQFSLPQFPLMYTSSWLCHYIYGWHFNEASPLQSLKRCQLPMLFIHGANDDYVPTKMVYELYQTTTAPKWLWIVPQAGHAEAYKCQPETYTNRITQFCNHIFE